MPSHAALTFYQRLLSFLLAQVVRVIQHRSSGIYRTDTLIARRHLLGIIQIVAPAAYVLTRAMLITAKIHR